MSSPAPILTQLTTVSFNSDVVGGVTSIKGIGSGKAKEIDVSTLASTAAEFVQGLRDFGTCTMELIRNQDDAGQLAMFVANAAQATETMVVTLPTSAANVITFSCFVVSIDTNIDKDGVVMGTATLRITGAIVFS